MRLGDVANPEAAPYGKPLEGVRVLALEQMQALPYATQLLARLGAEVVKVEHPVTGESGRASLPAMLDPEGRPCGATFLRNNLGKYSVGIDVKNSTGRELVLRLATRVDVFAENFRAGALQRLGLGYDDVAGVNPRIIYLSVSGFGNRGGSPYRDWPAYAPVVEAMSGIYEYARPPGQPPRPAPVGALGDISAALFGVVGVLAALRHRDRTGEGQYVDIAMLDAVIAMTDIVTNFWSMGLRQAEGPPLIMDAFQAADGWFVMQVGRRHQFERLATLVGRTDWLDDERLADGRGWRAHLDDVIRPAVDAWASRLTRLEACRLLGEAGVAAGPCLTAPEVAADPHVGARNMLVELPRTDGVADPVLIPGNPVKMSKVAEGPETRVPWVGEHTAEVLATELGLRADELASLRAAGVIA